MPGPYSLMGSYFDVSGSKRQQVGASQRDRDDNVVEPSGKLFPRKVGRMPGMFAISVTTLAFGGFR